MNITERDIFDFVFYQENLSSEKVEYLKTSRIFDEEIAFYRSLKKSLNEELSEEVKRKIAEKIPLYNPARFHVLYPVRDTFPKRNNHIPVLAAATPNENSSISAKTFIDEAHHYLIRLINFKNSSKIYCFSTSEEKLKNYKVIILPSGKTFEQSDNSSPIEIDQQIEAEKIELQFN
ncbi:MAG: hypothetical protein HXY50_10650 [Ignavibacteriaceae bacterium]|nr:hypothetical protein [Ignavibacteriaceae bacterium]